MDSNKHNRQFIQLDKIFLDLKNPRHIPYQSEVETIKYLCENEDIFNLAKDIALYGLNPLENLAVVKDDKTGTYVVAEGNRRLCAIKLLNDPYRAPQKFQKKFLELSSNWENISELEVIVIEDEENVDLWLTRIHAGQQQGIGRRQWDSEQKTRHFGDSKNTLAQLLLDYAEKEGLLTTDTRRGKLSVVQRFLTNHDFKNLIGISNKIEEFNPSEINMEYFTIFINDVAKGKIDTRTHSTSEQIREYVQFNKNNEDSSKSDDVNNSTCESSYSIDDKIDDGTNIIQNNLENIAEKPQSEPIKNISPKPRTKLVNSKDLMDKLKLLNNYKLSKIYYSLNEISVQKHPALITVGIWSFLESLTFLHGRDGGELSAYINNKFSSLGFDSKKHKAIKEAVQRFHESGNTTKHHPTAANFNYEQIINDFEVITPLLIAIINNINNQN
ncbi:hypothetical protein [Neisseria sp. HMSC70E02]|uniref:hypothetical protein n=1 Tax=Neisseria sp. HMSC70E02 TaxID=1608896 RepID=UPI0008A94F2D|nr:hypothetical protein [Neisseria sp. HMSC70E02]OHR79470.1 hypothetical protein HMPREF3277_12730 [Neisseria sp. HMSC70E02]